VRFAAMPLPKNEDKAAVQAALLDARVRSILVWARFPLSRIEQVGDSHRVTVLDARYGTRVGSATVMVER
jgi:hypothetical protein